MKPEVLRLCLAVSEAGGRAMLVGGTVRDRLLGKESKDFDVEVYGLEPGRLREVLERIARVNAVGEHFSVYKLVFFSSRTEGAQQERFEIDVSLPRRESKSGSGHRGFVIEGDPSMTFEEAARRRDFTINAILYDPLTEERVDPYRGVDDLQKRILRAVASDTFVEDSLRVLRAVQLAARFEMKIEPLTIDLCRTIDLSDLPRERICPEVSALASDSRYAASTTDSAFEHTKLAIDEAARESRALSKPERIAVMLATLCHELGRHRGNPTEAAKDDAVAEQTRSLLNTLGLYGVGGYDVRSQVLSLGREQRSPAHLYERREESIDGDFRRLASRVDIELLYHVAKSCAAVQTSPSATLAADWFIERARALGVEHGPPSPLLQGRHLIEAGYEPGPRMGRLLRDVYELQLEGSVTTLAEALAAASALDSRAPKAPEVFR